MFPNGITIPFLCPKFYTKLEQKSRVKNSVIMSFYETAIWPFFYFHIKDGSPMRQALEMFLKNSFDATEKENKAYCFIARAFDKKPVADVACRSWKHLWKTFDNQYQVQLPKIFTEYTYWTPNTFYNKERCSGSVRWLNSFTVDIDLKDNPGLSDIELLERIGEAGLPAPTMIIQSPSGGYHVFWYIEATRAYENVVDKYNSITGLIVEKLGADYNSVGPERYFRLPTQDNVLLFSKNHLYTYDFFVEWAKSSQNFEPAKTRAAVKVIPKGMLHHAAFRKMLAGVSNGIRDNTCFTLALALKVEGYGQDQAISLLLEWNQKNSPPLPLSDVKTKVKSAYSGKYKGPSAKWIRKCSGMDFKYQVLSLAKERKDRQRNHISEWAEDILILLQKNNGSWAGSQTELAKVLGAPVSSIKEALKCLIRDVKISMNIEGRGRGAKSRIMAITPSKTVKIFPAVTAQKAGFNASNSRLCVPQIGAPEIVHSDIHPMGLSAWVLWGCPDSS